MELEPIPNDDEPARRALVEILKHVMGAIDPGPAVRRNVELSGDVLRIGGWDYELGEVDRIFVVGAGKAAIPMAEALEEVLGERITRGLVIAPDDVDDESAALERIEVAHGSHPHPGEEGVEAARKLLEMVGDAGADDLVLCLLSGGGSSLMTRPAPGLALSELRYTNEALLESGMDIVQVNTIRKHLSAISGGRLCRVIYPAQSVTLVLSDVVGNRLDTVASGPTLPDPTTFEDAMALVERFRLDEQIPEKVVDHLRRGAAGEISETPKADNPCFEQGQVVVIGDNEVAARAAKHKADDLGWNATILSTFVEGEAREVGRLAAAMGKEVAHYDRPAEAPACLIMSGETTVTIRGDGRGGRNKELALAALLELEDEPKIAVASFGTDGIDGPTDSAGAVADRHTLQRSRQAELDPSRFLQINDSQSFFEETGDLLVTGRTGSNVNDLIVVFVED